ncbi:hypothetical protein [Streptomyces pinistramenti]|uniref:hypothetical protein n=1 Tax=Streptomyces pinistramenti TaxID=2884812 RepID=UPI001D07BFA6|nr:hypothetical protein [Streptomyces pinistramenti]MCB5911572.1 hypothetical protein [Streptomyces pinistramenti]
MKYAKSAAVVAGSVMALGAAAPAFAAGPAAPPTMSLNGGLTDALNSEQLDGHQIRPLVDTVRGAGEHAESGAKNLLGGATGATRDGKLLGGLPLGR